MSGPYDTERDTYPETRPLHEAARTSEDFASLTTLNRARLLATCDKHGVKLGAFDRRILAWLANYEPETCQVITDIIRRAYTAGTRRARRGASPDPDRREAPNNS
jgi:hypothetical protein